MMRAKNTGILASTLVLLLAAGTSLARTNWPPVLVIDDFESGIGRWDNRGTGWLASTNDAVAGKGAMVWTAADDGIGHIVYRSLDRADIDFSQYDILSAWIKIDGKRVWNINPIIQQAPAVYGFRGLYYSIDTLFPFGRWFRLSQDLTRWENAWPNSYSRTNQEFQFEITQMAGAGATRVTFDNIVLLRNPLGLKPSYSGTWRREANGDQVTAFRLAITNNGSTPLSVVFRTDTPMADSHFQIKLPADPVVVAPGGHRDVPVRAWMAADTAAHVAPYFGATIRLSVTVSEIPELQLFTELVAATRPLAPDHPCIACSVDRMRELQTAYADKESRATLDRGILNMVKQGEKALSYMPEYPALAATGRDRDPVSGAKLVEIDVPNLPFHVYQDPESGRSYSGPLYDAAMQGWLKKHMNNAVAAKQLGLAYLVTGRREFADAAARILRRYADVYLDLPITAPDAGSPVGSATSGSVRIGSTFMREHVWLANLAVALDCIRPAGVLTDRDIERIATRVFEPSADNMMDHKVGLMNLQWMIESAALFAGLAAEIPPVVARAMYDSHGIMRLTNMGFLPDGNWAENPSYQNVAKIAAYPALSAAIHNGLMPWDDRMQNRLKASYKLYGPDTRSPTLGTGAWTTPRLDDAGVAMFSAYITDPELAWVAYNRTNVGGTYGADVQALLRRTTPRVPRQDTRSPMPTGTTIAPDYGGIALRLPGTDRYCYMQYGRELTHGHRNKLSLNAYGKGHWFMRNVMGGYGDNFKDFLETIASANSIMVDGMNADADTGELLFHASTDSLAIAAAREIGAWKDVEHERAVVLTPGPLIVIDRCLSANEHTYDWLYHSSMCDLTLDTAGLDTSQTAPFGTSPRYSSLVPTGRFADSTRTVRLTRKDGSGLIICMLPGGELSAFQVTSLKRHSDGLLWRRRGTSVGYAAAYFPYTKAIKGDVLITSIPVTDESGTVLGLDYGQAVCVTSPQATYTVLANYSGKTLSAGPLRSADRVVVKMEITP